MGLSWASRSTLIYTSELILCSTICVHSATRHIIDMYPYFLFAAIHHVPDFLCPTSELILSSTSLPNRQSKLRETVILMEKGYYKYPLVYCLFFDILHWILIAKHAHCDCATDFKKQFLAINHYAYLTEKG